MRITRLAVLCSIIPSAAVAEWCEPPVAPELTSAELAQEFRDEFNEEFNSYFRDATTYLACLDTERGRVFEEIQITVERYDRFLTDRAHWDR